MSSRTTTGLLDTLTRATERHAREVALQDSHRSWTYERLATEVSALAAEIERQVAAARTPLVAIYADETAKALIGMTAVLAAGRAYVALDPRDPAERTVSILRSAGCEVLVVDRLARARLRSVLDEIGSDVSLIVVEDAANEMVDLPLDAASVDADALAYVHYTSGASELRGVMVSRASLSTVLASLGQHIVLSRSDRLVALADPASDLGLLEALLAWQAGARVCCPPQAETLLPLAYVRDQGITAWCLAPSRAAFLAALGALEPGLLPSLERTIFVGEDVTLDLVQRWSAAARNSTIEVLYGPVEATVACGFYRWDPSTSPDECDGGVLPLGRLLPEVIGLVVDPEGRVLPAGEAGELVLSGPQITTGFWRQPEAHGEAFMRPSGQDDDFLRTGDRACRLDDGLLLHLGRIDRQLRVRGFRVDLGEIERALSAVSGRDTTAAIGWPVTARGADGIVAFVEAPVLDSDRVQRSLRERLPRYMIPSQIMILPRLPRTRAGRIDRQALHQHMDPLRAEIVG